MTRQSDVHRNVHAVVQTPFDPKLDELDGSGRSPVHYAAEAGDFDALKMLVAWGCDPTRQTSDAETALDVCLDLGRFEMCDFVLGFETKWDPRPNGYNALDYPAMQGNVPAIKYLISKGASVDGQRGARPPVVWAVQEDQLAAFTALLAAGADPFRTASAVDDETAVSMAADDEKLPFLEVIFETERKDSLASVQSAYEIALAYEQKRAVQFLERFL